MDPWARTSTFNHWRFVLTTFRRTCKPLEIKACAKCWKYECKQMSKIENKSSKLWAICLGLKSNQAGKCESKLATMEPPLPQSSGNDVTNSKSESVNTPCKAEFSIAMFWPGKIVQRMSEMHRNVKKWCNSVVMSSDPWCWHWPVCGALVFTQVCYLLSGSSDSAAIWC